MRSRRARVASPRSKSSATCTWVQAPPRTRAEALADSTARCRACRSPPPAAARDRRWRKRPGFRRQAARPGPGVRGAEYDDGGGPRGAGRGAGRQDDHRPRCVVCGREGRRGGEGDRGRSQAAKTGCDPAALSAVALHKSVVLKGEPGSGKSRLRLIHSRRVPRAAPRSSRMAAGRSGSRLAAQAGEPRARLRHPARFLPVTCVACLAWAHRSSCGVTSKSG